MTTSKNAPITKAQLALSPIDREEAALKAMEGLISGQEPSLQFAAKIVGVKPEAYDATTHWPQYVAIMAFKFADAMRREAIRK